MPEGAAIEEGILRFTPDGPGLPTSTMYTASHVREDGTWLLAYSREWGAGQDRLGDLAFLIGKWEGGPKGQTMMLSFDKDPDWDGRNNRFRTSAAEFWAEYDRDKKP